MWTRCAPTLPKIGSSPPATFNSKAVTLLWTIYPTKVGKTRKGRLSPPTNPIPLLPASLSKTEQTAKNENDNSTKTVSKIDEKKFLTRYRRKRKEWLPPSTIRENPEGFSWSVFPFSLRLYNLKEKQKTPTTHPPRSPQRPSEPRNANLYDHRKNRPERHQSAHRRLFFLSNRIIFHLYQS